MYTQQPTQVTFSPETTKIIQEAFAGKVESLWEAEVVILNALIADTTLNPSVKATEITRCMNRFQNSMQAYRFAEVPMQGMSPYGEPLRQPMMMDRSALYQQHPLSYGMGQDFNPVAQPFPTSYNFQIPSDGEGDMSKTGTLLFARDINTGTITHITLYINGLLCPILAPVAVTEDDEIVGLAIITGHNVLNNAINEALFNALLEETNNKEQADSLCYSKRSGDENDVLYIGMVDYGDEVEKENFGDFVKGFTMQTRAYDILFKEAAE